ncbi:MAG: glycosyltransferase family 4 protein [Proteobacteria bacterium]|nr:glycosyltransferase family 4 protein [Pseudomonadota bacterium]
MTTTVAAADRTEAGARVAGPIWHLVDSRGIGGAERYIETVAQGLLRRGIAAEAVLLEDHGPNRWTEQLDAAGIRCRALDGSIGGLVEAIRQHRPSLIQAHGYKPNILGLIASKRARVPFVPTFHTGGHEPFPVVAYQLLEEWLTIGCPRLAVSEEIRKRLPFGATFIRNFMLSGPAPDPAPLPRRVVFAGRFHHAKWPEFFCELAARAPAGASFHMYGDGPLREGLDEIAKGRVQFHGVVTDMDRVWREAGLLVMCSRYEGLPYAGLEALSAGVPLLASRVGGLATLVVPGKTGWSFEAGDMEGALAGLEQWMACDEDRQRELRRSCWAHVDEGFSDRAGLPKLLELYERAGLKV